MTRRTVRAGAMAAVAAGAAPAVFAVCTCFREIGGDMIDQDCNGVCTQYVACPSSEVCDGTWCIGAGACGRTWSDVDCYPMYNGEIGPTGCCVGGVPGTDPYATTQAWVVTKLEGICVTFP